jgi:carotenoid cleavage dioxygenase-like enzyme
MLRRYGFDDGTVIYSNRFLRTEAYESAMDGSGASQFGTSATGLERIRRWLASMGPPKATDKATIEYAVGTVYREAMYDAIEEAGHDLMRPDDGRREEWEVEGVTLELAIAPLVEPSAQ